jgi:integrase
MKVSYYLANDNLIMLSFSFPGGRFRASTGETIDPDRWNQKEQIAVSSQMFNADELNFKLMRIKMYLMDEHRKQTNDGKKVTIEAMKETFASYLGKSIKIKSEKNELIPFAEKYVEKYVGGTKLLIDLTIRYIKEFDKNVKFDDINERWYNDFVSFLIKNKKMKKDTSIGLHVKNLKTILNAAFESRITNCTEQKRKYFKVFSEDSFQLYLTKDEIKSLYEFQVSSDIERHVLDMFILACYTGLRYTDWEKINKNNLIEGGRVLRVTTKKTGEDVCIPLHPIAREIMQKYDGIDLNKSNSNYDLVLKRIVKNFGMDRQYSKTFTHSGRKKTITQKKYEMISAHTARRSFATNAYLQGVPVLDIMKMTGHQTEKSFRRYIRIDKLQTAIRNIDHPFFNE